ncbi:MAG: hypothetical protein ACREBD_40465, partial [Blastocatellia bacterium]
MKAFHSQFPAMFPVAQYYVIAFFAFAAISTAHGQAAKLGDQAAKPANPAGSSSPRDIYRIEIDLDYHKASYTGREILQFTNSTREDLDFLGFYLYPNFGLLEEDEPSLTVQRVTAGGRDLYFSLRSRNALLRVELPQKLQPGQGIELELDFSARIPRVQREETSLLAHFLQEVSDALNDERQPRDARDIFFAGEEAMVLGYFFPMLAPRQQQAIEQNLAVSVGCLVNGEVADYEVTVKTDERLTLIASAENVESRMLHSEAGAPGEAPDRKSQTFRGEKLRGFAIAVVERMKSAERKAGAARAVSYFRESDERLGKRALDFVVNAINVYEKSFGDYPYALLQVVEAPLAAGYSSIQFPGMVVIAQAY